MGILHYLNVLEGDCTFIQHPSGHVSVIDVNNAYPLDKVDLESAVAKSVREALRVRGDFNQKARPVNPIGYLRDHGVSSVFRFILTHPDMDHMGGIRAFFPEFDPTNFWDTDNAKEMVFDQETPWSKEDWEFYLTVRHSSPETSPRRLALTAGAQGKYYNQSEDGSSGGDGLYILSPTPELVQQANETGDYNDSSYVLLYRAVGAKILIAGDSHDRTWRHILANYKDDVSNLDLLLAPHHGRKSDRSYDFLDVTKPKLTFFGNARAEDLAYDAWRRRGLRFVTNNQANCMVVDASRHPASLYVTHEAFARAANPETHYSVPLKAYYCYDLT